MTCGIYKLVFNNTEKVYVGKSVNIERRFTGHKSKLNNTESPKKLQNAYELYGMPILVILEEVGELLLHERETYWVNKYNSIQEGFNTIVTSIGGSQTYTGPTWSKFAEEDIEEAFFLLVTRPDFRAEDVSKVTTIPKTTIDAISGRKVYTWLQRRYPDMYEILINKSKDTSKFGKGKTLKERGIKYPNIISPAGISYSVENTSQFAIAHKLNNAHLVQVLKGKEKQHKGWKLEIV